MFCSSVQDKLSTVCHLIKKQLEDISCHETNCSKVEKVKEKDFSEILSKDILGQMSEDLEISQRANVSSTEITVHIYMHMLILYFCVVYV